jgi:hypothetical protein
MTNSRTLYYTMRKKRKLKGSVIACEKSYKNVTEKRINLLLKEVSIRFSIVIYGCWRSKNFVIIVISFNLHIFFSKSSKCDDSFLWVIISFSIYFTSSFGSHRDYHFIPKTFFQFIFPFLIYSYSALLCLFLMTLLTSP